MSVTPPVVVVNPYLSTPAVAYKTFENLTRTFVMPSAGSQCQLVVLDSRMYAINEWIWIDGIGYLKITDVPNDVTLTVQNPASATSYGNQIAGTVVGAGTIFAACPDPIIYTPPAPDPTTVEMNFYDRTADAFDVPSGTAPVSIALENGSWLTAGASGIHVFIEGAGYFVITGTTFTGSVATIQFHAEENNGVNEQQNYPAGTHVNADAKIYPCAYRTLQVDADSTAALRIDQDTTQLNAHVHLLPAGVLSIVGDSGLIQCGNCLVTINATSFYDMQVTFNPAFSTTPLVLLTQGRVALASSPSVLVPYPYVEMRLNQVYSTIFSMTFMNSHGFACVSEVNWVAYDRTFLTDLGLSTGGP